MGPLGSQGCSATASATFQVPRSTTPERGVDQLVVLTAPPKASDSTQAITHSPGSKAASTLHGADHVCIVQVAVAEVESDQWSCR